MLPAFRWHGLASDMIHAFAAAVLLVTATPGDETAPPADSPHAGRPIDFVRDVRPIFEASCYSCHGQQTQKGGYRLDVRAVALGDGDEPQVLPGRGGASPLVLHVSGAGGETPMPPKGDRLSAEQVGVLRAWIDQGAPWPDGADAGKVERPGADHWAFRPASSPPVPTVDTPSRWARNPIDAFVLEKLRARGLGPSPEADKVTLIRRLNYDLAGLPPGTEEVEAFLADDSPDAYEKLLDRLLASPAFGERWGRHWLDAAGFVDVVGGDNDAGTVKFGEGKWRYRDWAVRAIGADEPFDAFLVEQMAGDELVDWRSAATFTPEARDLLTATGFLRVAADDTDEVELNLPPTRHAVLQRTLETVSGNLLALTVNCARCHDHKFDPISQRDYFALASAFQPALNPDRWLAPKDRGIDDVPPAQRAAIDRHNAEVDRRVGELRCEQAALRKPHEDRLLAGKLDSTVPEGSREPLKVALGTAEDKRDDAQKQLVAAYGAAVKVTPEEVAAALGDEGRKAVEALEREALAVASTREAPPGTLQALYDVGPPTPTRLLKRGDPSTPGEEVGPGMPTILSASPAAAPLDGPPPYPGTSGRRLALAHRLTDAATPAGALVARVRVNRIWQHAFGKGIVATGDNFGTQGTPPTHPELLEWLASRFVSGGWRLKPMLRLLMTSATYRQASSSVGIGAGGAEPEAADPADDYLWRMRLRRLESEAVRDSTLVVAGRLDRTLGGPPIWTIARPDGSVAVREDTLPTATARWRRSLYLLARRNYHPTILGVFDQPVVATNCTARQSSAVVTQALTMLNDAFFAEQADAFAARVLAGAGPGGRDSAIDMAFRVALARPPRDEERAWCSELLGRHEARSAASGAVADEARRSALVGLCHVLLSSSEFLYIP